MSESIWDSWPEVPREHTKHVNQRGGYTTIEAYWIIQTLTEKFGPMGEKWGLQRESSGPCCDDALWRFQGRFWYMTGDTVNEFPIDITERLKTVGDDGKVRYDEDAPKKALTAAISKASSYLGLASAIYLGQWDKNGGGGTSSPAKATWSTQGALTRLLKTLTEEFGPGGLYPKKGEGATPVTQKKLDVFKDIFGTTSWNEVKGMSEAKFKSLCTKGRVKEAIEKVKANEDAPSSTTDGSPPVSVQEEVF